ncbi:MAG: peptidylprolyl isomerase [Candidatus Altiarchaeota archaeon]|nr:peptidylprolyl isomerase [Candidatus Altiarchaeota archaeon]
MDFIKISYTGKVKDGRVFDTTEEDVAKKENIFDSKRVYKPTPIVVGEGNVVAGLDEALKSLKVGDKKTVEVAPDKGFGQRDPGKVRLVPIKFFRDQNINPIPGMPVEIDGMPARIQTVAGGRVRVDFNNDLAGKNLVYHVEVKEKASGDEDKVNYILERSFNASEGFDVKLSGKKLALGIPESAQRDRNLLVRKASFSAEAFKYLGLDEVKFEEVWKNPDASKKSEEKAEKQDKKKK